MRSSKTDSRCASANEIREIVGPIDGEVMARILEIEPSIEDVQRACCWLCTDNDRSRDSKFDLGGKTERVLEILDDELPDFDSSGHPQNPR